MKRINPKLKKFIWCMVSIFVVFMIRYSVSGGITDSDFPDLASKVIYSFSNSSAMDLLLFAGVLWLLTVKKDENKGLDIWILLGSVFFALLYVLGLCCQQLGEFLVFFENKPLLFMLLLTVAAYAVIFYHALKLLFLWMEKGGAGEEHSESKAFPFFRTACIIFLCWLPWLLMNYPCSFCNDAAFSLRQWIGIEPWTSATPL